MADNNPFEGRVVSPDNTRELRIVFKGMDAVEFENMKNRIRKAKTTNDLPANFLVWINDILDRAEEFFAKE